MISAARMIPFRAKAPKRAFVEADASESSSLGGVMSGCTIKRQEKASTFESMCVTYGGGEGGKL